ncbi:MAG: LCCL domain-containing protein [Microbacteriaceae bacterium]
MKRFLPILGVVALLLVGCAPSAPEPPPLASVPEFVQDFWVIDSATALTSDYEWVEFLPEFLEALQTQTADASHTLLDGLEFRQYDLLKPKMTNAQGLARSDVKLVAGLLSANDKTTLAVLASPDRGTKTPIGAEDYVLLDLSLVGHLITPGDPVLLDYSLVQARPELSEEERAHEGIELLQYRFSKNLVNAYGTQGPNGPEYLNYVEQLGMILQGSEILGLPAKSQDMVGGLWDGVEGCVEEIRNPIFGLKCAQSIFEDFGLGALGSWKQIEENFEPFDIPQRDAKNEEQNPAPTPTTTPPPSTTPKQKCPEGQVPVAGSSTCVPLCDNCDTDTKVVGDPHILTFDGKFFPMHGIGEFLVTKNDTFQAQIRTQETRPGRQISSVSAIAFEHKDTKFLIDAQGIWVDGVAITEASAIIGEHHIVQSNLEIAITNTRDYFVRIVPAGWALDFHLSMPKKATPYIGMMGNNNDVEDDFIDRQGRFLGEKLSFRDFYRSFVNSWRISDAESLFPYEAGKNTASYTDLSFPKEEITSASFPEAERDIAERLCVASGMKYADFIEACMLDILVLGELNDLTFIGELRTVTSHMFVERQAASVHDYPAEKLWGGREIAPKPWERKEASNRPDGEQTEFIEITWERTADRYLNFDGEASYRCVGNGVVSPVWGGEDGVYDTQSSVCTAAVHAGLIDPMRGGTVNMMRLDGSYSQSKDFVQNGITAKAKQNFEGFNFITYGDH